jgi:hypothetical protein
VALSFLYIAFVRSLQLVRLSWGEQQDLAIEVVMLRQQLGEQLDRRGGGAVIRWVRASTNSAPVVPGDIPENFGDRSRPLPAELDRSRHEQGGEVVAALGKAEGDLSGGPAVLLASGRDHRVVDV